MKQLITAAILAAILTTIAIQAKEPKSLRRFYDLRSDRDLIKLNIPDEANKSGYTLTDTSKLELPEEFIGDFEIRFEVAAKHTEIKFHAHGETFSLIKGGSKAYLLTCKAGIMYISLYPKRYNEAVGKIRINTLRSKVIVTGHSTIKRVTITKGTIE